MKQFFKDWLVFTLLAMAPVAALGGVAWLGVWLVSHKPLHPAVVAVLGCCALGLLMSTLVNYSRNVGKVEEP